MGAIVLGCDPGFASFGWARLELGRSGRLGVPAACATLLDWGVITTKPSPRKVRVLAGDDNARRARQIAQQLAPLMADVRLVCAESLSFVRDASVMAKMGLAWGVLVGLCEAAGVPLAQATPQALKAAACGTARADKLQVAARMREQYACSWAGPHTRAEHAYDAVAAFHACRYSDLVRAVMASTTQQGPAKAPAAIGCPQSGGKNGARHGQRIAPQAIAPHWNAERP